MKDNLKPLDKYYINKDHKLGKGGMATVYMGCYMPEKGDENTLFAVK